MEYYLKKLNDDKPSIIKPSVNSVSRGFKVMNVILKYRKSNLNSPSAPQIDTFSRKQ